MNKCLIITFEIAPEVTSYMSSHSMDLDRALRNLNIDISDGLDTRLKIVEEGMLNQYGKEGNDYVVVRGMDTLDFWGYTLDEVCEDLNIDLDGLRNLGVDIEAGEHRV